MLSISKHTDLHFRARNVRELDRTTETFVLLWVVVLETNLKLNRFDKVAFFLIGFALNSCDPFSKNLALKLTVHKT